MVENGSVNELLIRLRGRDNDAATEVFNRFAHRLCALAKSQLDTRIRQKVDPEDVLLSAYKSFFARHADGSLDVSSWDAMWTLLTVITVRKCQDQAAYFQAAKRDVRREAVSKSPDNESQAFWSAIDREPTPLEAVTLSETVEVLMHGLDDHERDILALSLQGYTAQEISSQLGRAERTVQRVRERAKNRLMRMASAP